jgi:hypothetical protein
MEYFSVGVGRLGREGDHSSPSNAKVKNEWSYNSISFICIDGMCRDGFTFT